VDNYVFHKDPEAWVLIGGIVANILILGIFARQEIPRWIGIIFG
jgi:hypothetical protein